MAPAAFLRWGLPRDVALASLPFASKVHPFVFPGVRGLFHGAPPVFVRFGAETLNAGVLVSYLLHTQFPFSRGRWGSGDRRAATLVPAGKQ